MKNFKVYNRALGWLAFLTAAVVYLITIEPTTSLWDCGEFIASAYKLEVGHPPGAPLHMIMARVATLFAGSSASAAKMINALSALASAFTIMFLFWTITHLAKKLIAGNKEMNKGQMIAVLASGLVGAMAYAFSDTFWFSAVEGEVYGTSSLFTALVFWSILKWENVADEKHADRWLILIAYLMGLSIGIHLLNLLAIPAIAFVYYFRKHTFSIKGFSIALVISFVLISFVMWGIIPGIAKTSSQFELLFVNTFGFGYNSGVLIHLVFLVISLILAIYYTHFRQKSEIEIAVFSIIAITLLGIPFLSGSVFVNLLLWLIISGVIYHLARNNKVILNTILTSAAVIFIGYSSFTMIFVRSLADPPMDENNPENVFSLLYYLNREQYGASPVLYGQYFNAQTEAIENGKPMYRPRNGKYEIIKYNAEVKYDERFMTLFPRMWSPQPDHKTQYRHWGRIKGIPVSVNDGSGKTKTIYKPTFFENIRFFINYQIGHMYFRYLMWNFAGRQNDIQGHGGPLKGNWISGIDFLDEMRLGPQDALPKSMDTPTRNKYFMLPLLLGLVGLLFQLQRDKKNFWVTSLLFLMTGIAIVVYLNQYPNQPRERDYAYAGSFYVFTIWIGLGVLAFYDIMKEYIPGSIAATISGLAWLILVPGIMVRENWDDHDRSGKYFARDIAYNYLNSCAPNAILITNGDNDTFPLWYAQEVEGIRTDVRVVNTMLFNTDWYIEQMKRKAYESEALPLSLPLEKYQEGTNNQVFIIDRVDQFTDIDKIVGFVKNDERGTKIRTRDNEWIDYIPTKKFRIPVNRTKVLANGTVAKENADKIVPYIDITIDKNYILKSQLMLIDFLAQNDWERPVYFVTGGTEDAFGLEDYFQLEGFAYRLVPIKTARSGIIDYGRINSDVMYDNLVNKFNWGRVNEPDVFVDYYTRRTLSVMRVRNNYARLAKSLVAEGKRDSAITVLDRCVEVMPLDKLPNDIFTTSLVEGYYMAGAKDKADSIAADLLSEATEDLEYYFSMDAEFQDATRYEKSMSLQILQDLMRFTSTYEKGKLQKETEQKFGKYYQMYRGVEE